MGGAKAEMIYLSVEIDERQKDYSISTALRHTYVLDSGVRIQGCYRG